MKTKLIGNLYMVWVIASKDIVDALKNKDTRTNIILMMGMVVFFYWASTLRPFDERIATAASSALARGGEAYAGALIPMVTSSGEIRTIVVVLATYRKAMSRTDPMIIR